MSSKKIRLLAAAVVLLLSLGLIACGKDGLITTIAAFSAGFLFNDAAKTP